MKKLYTTLTGTLIAISACASPLASHEIHTSRPVKKMPVKTEGISFKSLCSEESGPMKIQSVRKADSTTSLEGDWTFQFGDYYFDNESVGSFSAKMTAFVEGDVVRFEDATDRVLPFEGTFDSSTNVITFSRTYLGQSGNFFVYQAPYIYNYATENLDFQTLEVKYNPQLGILIFPAANGDPGIAWPAYADPEGTVNRGFFDIFDFEGASKVGGGIDVSDWQDVGNAIFMDGWVLPATGLNQADYQYEVPLQQDAANTNRYRLVDPYKYGPLATYNTSKETGYIIFDVTDPDHVVFEMANAGFAWSDLGISALYCYNQLGAAIQIYGFTAEEVIDIYPDGTFPYTTFKDGIVTLSYIEDFNETTGKPYNWYDANFGYQGDPNGGQIWADGNGQPVNMSARIVFPGADAVETIGAEENATAEYFNLQGVRVSNPEKGQILIVRRGGSTGKIVF